MLLSLSRRANLYHICYCIRLCLFHGFFFHFLHKYKMHTTMRTVSYTAFVYIRLIWMYLTMNTNNVLQWMATKQNIYIEILINFIVRRAMEYSGQARVLICLWGSKLFRAMFFFFFFICRWMKTWETDEILWVEVKNVKDKIRGMLSQPRQAPRNSRLAISQTHFTEMKWFVCKDQIAKLELYSPCGPDRMIQWMYRLRSGYHHSLNDFCSTP